MGQLHARKGGDGCVVSTRRSWVEVMGKALDYSLLLSDALTCLMTSCALTFG